MTHKNTTLIWIILLGMVFLCLIGLSACQPQSEQIVTEEPSKVNQPTIPASNQSSNSASSASPTANQAEPSAEPTAGKAPVDPAVIQAGWQASPHANTFILDAEGQNNTCARCHAPINWKPAMDELPESCFACKFEVEDPPPLIPESEWENIPCKVCHSLDKKGNVQPEYAWLEIAPLDEYAKVASPTELCLKCHAPTEIPGHANVVLGGAHANYECTGCHSAHDTTASCDAVGCHSDVISPAAPIPGHDADHEIVTCVACHDGSGMEVGPEADSGYWTTFAVGPADTSGNKVAFTSHNVVLEARCDRCHYADNPWGLSAGVAEP